MTDVHLWVAECRLRCANSIRNTAVGAWLGEACLLIETLAGNADDDEPVTAGWLASVMTLDRDGDGIVYGTPGRGVYFYLDGAVFIEHREYGPAHTRGDVRRLCAALGVDDE